MKLFVSFRDGGAIVENSKILSATSDAAEAAVRAVLTKPQIDEGEPFVTSTGIVEGEIRKLRHGTIEFDRKALSTLPDAFVSEA